jgi:hypothetical protein
MDEGDNEGQLTRDAYACSVAASASNRCKKLPDYMGQVLQCKAELARISTASDTGRFLDITHPIT